MLLGLAAGSCAAAGLSALVFANEAIALPALYAMGAGGYVVASTLWQRLVPGILAIVVGLLAVVGALNLSIGETGFDATWLHEHAAALAVAANIILAGSTLTIYWQALQVWLAGLTAAVMVLVVVFAMISGPVLDDHASGAAIAVGLLSLICAIPAALLIRDD